MFMSDIEQAESRDIPEIMEVMTTGLTTTKNKDWYVTDDITFVERHIAAEGYILKCMAEHKIAGFLIVRHPQQAEDNLGRCLPEWTEELLDKVAHMESAAVLPRYRGQGIQKKLLLAAEEAEKQRGTVYLMATVHPDNIYSRKNLEQSGYVCLLETEKYGGLQRIVLCKKI